MTILCLPALKFEKCDSDVDSNWMLASVDDDVDVDVADGCCYLKVTVLILCHSLKVKLRKRFHYLSS